MRVVSGSRRGTKLYSPEGLYTRPTLDRVKEALFSALTPYIPAARVLDAFAGSGALGIEALSRGCSECTFVDNSHAALEIVRKNLELTRLMPLSHVVCDDAIKALSKFDMPFDLVFLDPPYESALMAEAMEIISSKKLLSSGGVMVLEWDSARPDVPEGFETIREKRYGRVNITLVRGI
ncbi:MAG: 16S rRNA (guanine(966)-N(2))-methyltransferase RsmD [Clostridia bacterium]|nr:16S rRNA (guanine(966)-N(2))-methyltransferase RsmD [Clostridia bacterium]